MTVVTGSDAPWKRRLSNTDMLDTSHLKEADGKRVIQLFAKIEANDKTIFESKNSIDAFIAQKSLYQEKTKQKEIQTQIRKMEKRIRHCNRDKKRYQKEIQDIDPSAVFEEDEEDEDDTASSVIEATSTFALTKEPLNGGSDDQPPPISFKRAGSDGIHQAFKKTLIQGIGKLRRSHKESPRGRSDSLGRALEGDDGRSSDVDEDTSDNLESDTPMTFLSDSGPSRGKPSAGAGRDTMDSGMFKELAGTCRGISVELETVRLMVGERKTDLETKFNALQHLLHNQAQMLEYMDGRMADMSQSLYQAVENGFKAVDERMEVLDERIVTEVNILGAEVRDSIVDHESVFQHIQDHEGRIKEIEDVVRSDRFDGWRYLSLLTPLISALSIVVIYIAKASSKMNAHGITPQIQLSAMLGLVAYWLWYG